MPKPAVRNMVKIRILVITIAMSLVGACASRQPPLCKERPLSKEEIIDIAREEIKKRDGDPESIKTSVVKIKRDGCVYIYYQVFRPKSPGGYLFVRIDEFGNVIDYMPGL
jgi:hypothetical protein